MSDPLPLSRQHPPTIIYSVMPPDEYWLLRWHWLRSVSGDLRCFNWSHLFGWHSGHGGQMEREEMLGWSYYAPALPPSRFNAAQF